MGLFGRFAEALAFLPAPGLSRLSEGRLVRTLGGFAELRADFLWCDSKATQNLFLPSQELPSECLFGPPELSEFIPEALNLELEVGVAGGLVVKVAVFFPFIAVGSLQGAPLRLIASRIGVCRIVRKVETLQRRVARTTVAGE